MLHFPGSLRRRKEAAGIDRRRATEGGLSHDGHSFLLSDEAVTLLLLAALLVKCCLLFCPVGGAGDGDADEVFRNVEIRLFENGDLGRVEMSYPRATAPDLTVRSSNPHGDDDNGKETSDEIFRKVDATQNEEVGRILHPHHQAASEYLLEGMERQKRGDSEGAERSYEAAARVAGAVPGLENRRAAARAHSNLGGLRQLRQDFEGAKGDYAAALFEDPASCTAYNNLGQLRKRLGDVAGARRSLRAAVCLDPRVERARWNLAELWLQAAMFTRTFKYSNGVVRA